MGWNKLIIFFLTILSLLLFIFIFLTCIIMILISISPITEKLRENRWRTVVVVGSALPVRHIAVTKICRILVYWYSLMIWARSVPKFGHCLGTAQIWARSELARG